MVSNIFNVHGMSGVNEDSLFAWQKHFFNRLFLLLLVLGILPWVLSCSTAVQTGEWRCLFFYSGVYLWVGGIVFFKTWLFPVRVWAGISVFYVLGGFSLFSLGQVSSAGLYFLCFSGFAALFSGAGGGVAALLLNIATLAAYGIYHGGGMSPGPFKGIAPQEEWMVILGTFSLLGAVLTLSLAVLIKVLENSSRGFSHLVKNTADIVWTLDHHFTVLGINSSVHDTFGFLQEELTGKPITHFIDEKKIEQFKHRVQREDNFNYEAILHHKDGTPVHVEISGLKINCFSRGCTMYQGIIRNLSRKKAREEEQDQLKKRLVQAEKYRAVGILAGSVAHDLNNILSGIATYPEVLLMDKDLPPQIVQGLTMIKDSGQKASDVVSDLLTISRGSGAEKEIININSILDRYTSAPDFEKIRETYQQVEIEILAEPELLNIKGSYIHIEKIIMNLFLNAVEEVAGRDGGRVFITTANRYIDAATPGQKDIVPGEYAVLSVIDNGSGIDENNLKKIFEPYFTKKEMGRSGTGLGLTVVWNAVQDHNGFINVISDKKGTTFDLMFPAVRQEIPQKAAESSLEEIRGRGQTILVVDDLKDQQKIATSILGKLGYHAHAVDDGYAAVEFIKNNSTDLVVLDMLMAPSISGLNTYRMIKKIKPDQKAIIASGYSESEEVLMAQEMGAGSFVKKPYTILDMGIAVKEELEK